MRIRSLTTPAALLALSCMLHTPAAKADTYTFTISTPAGQAYALTGSGTITTTRPTLSGGVNGGTSTQFITGITGSIDNSANTLDTGSFPITLLDTTSPGALTRAEFHAQQGSDFFFYYDNLLLPDAATPLDGNGLAFTANGVSYNIGYNGSQAEYLALRSNDINFDQHTYQGIPINFTLAQSSAVTPEPLPIALLGTGLLALAALIRRRIA